MTRPFDLKTLPFYITLPAPCPYLPDEMERKVFTPLDPLSGPFLNDYLTHSGFRRSQNVIYRPACEACRSCKPLRVRVCEFRPSTSFRRNLRMNADLHRELREPLATDEQYALLKLYLGNRHRDGGMAGMDFDRFEMMVEDCSSQTGIAEYRMKNGRLIACCITDELGDGLSMVYSFFNPEFAKRGLGNFMILDHITLCREFKHPYLYLGYWVKDSPKMDYKAKFKPYEILSHGGWRNENGL